MTTTIQEFVEKLQAKFPAEKNWDAVYYIIEGKRYWKIARHDKCGSPTTGSNSVYAFVDKNTGDLFKPASWSTPAKYARGNINDETGLAACNQYSVRYL